ncbi:recombination protein RecA [Nitrosomonas sp. Nm132]|nr:recombination protein RecA [Nitrosomonas sp. Nm132]
MLGAVLVGVRCAAIPDIEHMVAFVLMCTYKVAIEQHVIAQQRVGNHAFAASKVFTRLAFLHGWTLNAEFLAIDGAV